MADIRGLFRRAGAQAVIDGGEEQAFGGAEPRGGVHQGGGIRPTGDGEKHRRWRPLQEGREGAGEAGVEIGRDQAAQRARFCSRSTPWRTLAPAPGNLRSTSASVAQAWALAPRAWSEAPSFIIASGATGEAA